MGMYGNIDCARLCDRLGLNWRIREKKEASKRAGEFQAAGARRAPMQKRETLWGSL